MSNIGIKEKLLEWKASGLGLIDLRSTELFEKFHVAGGTNIPAKKIPELAHELPPKVRHLYLVGSEEELKDADAYCSEHRHVIDHRFISTEEFWTQVKELDLFIENSHISKVLWSPTPCIEGVIDQIEALRMKDGLKSSGLVLDLACGAARDMVFLAARGWTAIGVDYLEKLKVRAMNLARRAGVTIDYRCVDIETNWKTILDEFKEKADVVHVSRFLDRDLMDFIKNLIRPGGFIVYHTFMEGCLKPKTKKYLLAAGELKAIFGHENQFEIIEDRVIHLEDGRPTSYFLARKRDNSK
jgi:SAM-dependent methyltransferase